jgi:hypothetical protein
MYMVRKRLRRLFAQIKSRENANLVALISNAKKLFALPRNDLRILFASGFNMNRAFTNHDVIMASLLRFKGARVFAAIGVNRLQNTFPFYGGVWGSGSQKKDFAVLEKGERRAQRFFQKIGQVIRMDSIISRSRLEEIRRSTLNLTQSQLLEYSYNGIPIGHDAMNAARNVFLVSDINLVPDSQRHLRDSLINCIVYAEFLSKIIDTCKPDRIFSHDSFYYPWALLQKMAAARGIPFYNYYCEFRPDAYIYAYNRPAMDLDMTELWGRVRDMPLPPEHREKMLSTIEYQRKKGVVGLLALDKHNNEKEKESVLAFARQKPTAVLYGNVVWDLCALDKDIFFTSIRNTFTETIRYFIAHPQYHLILKSHPAEEHSKLPVTVEQLRSIIAQEFGELPPNIMVLPPKTGIKAYDLFPVSKCTIVYSTTTGLESVIFGTPTVTTANSHYRGKGFTYDPTSVPEYFETLERLLNLKEADPDSHSKSEQALKYFYYFYYELFYQYGIPSMSYYGDETRLTKKTCAAYLENKRLNQLLDTIIDGRKIDY